MEDGGFGERGGEDNIERWLGTEFQEAGEGADAYLNIAEELRQAGHGAASIVWVGYLNDDGSPGTSHIFNAVNYNGTVVWVDTQSREVMSRPINTAYAGPVLHISLDADARPLHAPSTPEAEGHPSDDDATYSDPGGRQDQPHDTNPSGEGDAPAEHPPAEAQSEPASESDPDRDPASDPEPNPASDPASAPESHPDSEPAHSAADTRPRTDPGGILDPDPAQQQDLENSVPRTPDGVAQPHPDPNEGNWTDFINQPGADTPGRSNNCVDVALSTADTYAGTPTAAGARTPDGTPDGVTSDRGEAGGRDRMENALGARFTDFGNGRRAFDGIESTLRDAGHGSQAVIVTQGADGRAHAWNVVNHHDRITYIDAQTGRRSDTPLHSGDHGVFAVPLDAARRPLADSRPTSSGPHPAATPARPHHNAGTRPAAHTAPPGSRPAASAPPSGSTRRPSANPAGAPASLIPHPDDAHPRLEREGPQHLRSGLPADAAQQRVRESNPVFRLVPGAVDQQLSDWAKGGQLAHVLRVATGQDSDPHAAAHKPTTFTTDGLNKALPGFADLNRGEKMMVISTLARLSHTAHEQYGVNGNPIDTGKESEGALKHKEIGVKAKKLMDKLGLKHLGDAGHIPDLSNRNYAVIELDGPHGIEYVVDSSYPNKKGVGGKHSERHLYDWIAEVNEASGPHYKISALYTEREPCGDKKGGLSSSNCSDLLSKELAGVPIYYSTTYRADQAQEANRSNRREALYAARRAKLGLEPNQALPEEAKKKINSQVRREFPKTDAEKERDKEMNDHVKKVESLWSLIGHQL